MGTIMRQLAIKRTSAPDATTEDVDDVEHPLSSRRSSRIRKAPDWLIIKETIPTSKSDETMDADQRQHSIE
jgi:hypothetical protein